MVTDSRKKVKYANLGSFSTYDAPRTWTVAETFSSSRSRSWTRMFKGRKAAMVQLLAQGFLPTTAYVDDLQEVVNSKVVTFSGLLSADPRSTFVWSIIPATARYPVSVDTDAKVISLVASVQEKLQSKISGNGTNLAVTATEAEETVGMIGVAVKKLFTAYRHVRHGNFRAGALALGLQNTPKRVGRRESFGDNWLQYRYGWRLVVTDIASLMKTLYNVLSTRPPILRVTSWDANERIYSWNLGQRSLTMPNGTALCTYDLTQKTRFVVQVRGGYVYELQSVPLATGQSFGLTNPAVWAWEVIPYSFVLDWAVNVGSVLEGITAFQGKRCLDGWICKSIESSTEYFWSNLKKSSGVTQMWDSGERYFGPVVERRFARSAMAFTPSSLRLDLSLNTERVIDAISMLKQQVMRK